MICTIYSNTISYDTISNVIKKHIPKSHITYSGQDGFQIINVEVKKGIFSSSDKFKISYRQRTEPNTDFNSQQNCALSNNLQGLYGFVSKIPARNIKSQQLFLLKIKTLNCEFSIIPEKGELNILKNIISELAKTLDAILFVQPNSIISKSSVGQHFLNKDLALVLDQIGASQVDNFGPEIEAKYQALESQYQHYLEQIPKEQKNRKLANEKTIHAFGIKVNKYLPPIQNETGTTLRTTSEVKTRVLILAIINGFALNQITKEQTINFLIANDLLESITPKEKDLLDHPTEDKKSNETWKCEGIWVLLWALNIQESLGDFATLCDLGNIPRDKYPIHNPKGFLEADFLLRSKKEILDQSDLYYRLDWANVDLRLKGLQSPNLNQGLVYERHYALNWLINYMGQAWDDVSCDT